MCDLPYALASMGYEIDVVTEDLYDSDIENPDLDAALEKKVIAGADFVMSYQFFPQVAAVCHRHGMKYISWIYDSPYVAAYSDEAKYPENYIFALDKLQCEHLWQSGIDTVHHMPMGAGTDRINQIELLPGDEAKYTTEVSFVGQLYSQNAYNRLIGFFDENNQRYLKEYLISHLCDWGEIRKWPILDKSCLDFCNNNGLINVNESFGFDMNYLVGISILSYKLAEMDRVTILNTLAQRHRVDLYTRDNTQHLQGVNVHPGVDYDTEMSKVFSFSKINLNITIPAIPSGIPQRVWDIIGSGGFCMTNHQPEVEDYFTVGEDIETFKSFEELEAKVDFYLKHEDARLRVLVKGYEKVMKYHTYQNRIADMMKIAGIV